MEQESFPTNFNQLAPTPETRLSAVLNGVGNATMLAAASALLLGEEMRMRHKNLLFAGTGLAVALGAAWGWHEAKEVDAYRNALKQEIEHLRSDVDRHEAQNKPWREKIAEEHMKTTTEREL